MKQIGKYLIYDQNGKVTFDSGEREGWDGLNPPNLSIEYPSYDPTIHSVMVLAYGERADEFNNMGSCEVVGGQLVIYPRLTLLSDKQQIQSDGVDTATLSIHLPDAVSENVTLTIEGSDTIVTTDATGNTTYGFTSSLSGSYTITASHPKYGQVTVTIEVV